MKQRSLLLLLGLALLVGAVYVLSSTEERPAAPPLESEQTKAPEGDPAPGLRSHGEEPPTPTEPAPPPTADEWLRHWDPADGIPLGDDLLRGTVVDPAGKPIFDARVYLRARAGQPAILDAPSTWEARSDADGNWQIEMAHASRSLLCAWAPGYERAHLEELDPDSEIRVVLEPAPALTVTVKAPPSKAGLLDGAPLEDARIRVRLGADNAHEQPRPGEPLRAVWDHLVETGVPTQIRLPRGVAAYLTADAPQLASDPPWVALPIAAKDVVFQLIPSASIELRLLDAETKKTLALGDGGWGFTSVIHQETGFELDSDWSSEDSIWHVRGVVRGTYAIRAAYRGYTNPLQPRLVQVVKPDARIEVDLPLQRDMQHGTLHLLLRHAPGSQHAGAAIQSGLTLVRRREAKPPTWTYGSGASWMLADGRMKRTLDDLPAGTYDVLAWDGSRFPPVGHLVGVEVAGGSEETVDVVLEEGYGFRPGDALGGTGTGSARMRAQSKLLGTLPWVAWVGGELGLFQADAEGFAGAPTTGYIGPYPSKQITLVEQPQGGKANTHELQPSISPPR